MKEEVKQEWLKALRSGEYDQTQGKLHKTDGFCCLGVLCDISGEGNWQQYDEEIYVFTMEDKTIDADGMPPSLLQERLSVDLRKELPLDDLENYVSDEVLGRLRQQGEYGANLAQLNDNGAFFDEIADVVDHFF